jgi:hypothetical protein
MKQRNGRLIVVVAVVGVVAVVTGGVIASQRGPRTGTTSAAPLVGKTPTTTPVAETPPTTPVAETPTPTATPSTAPVRIKLDLGKLSKGRDPQVPYLVGREVRGGAGDIRKIPGKEQIQQIARRGDDVLAVLSKGTGTELLQLGITNTVLRTPDVTTLVTTDDESRAAYGAVRTGAGGQALKGGIVYAEAPSGQLGKLQVPNGWNLQVLAYRNGKVYYRSGDNEAGSSWKLYEWAPDTPKATEIRTVASPTGLSGNGEVAASVSSITSSGTCSAVTVVATGKRLWKTCENQVVGFTPDGGTAIGAPAYIDGYSNGTVSALDAKTGRLIREWTGSFHQTVAEDDQHLLIVADGGSETTKASIIRCDLTTGSCELATPLAVGELKIGR